MGNALPFHLVHRLKANRKPRETTMALALNEVSTSVTQSLAFHPALPFSGFSSEAQARYAAIAPEISRARGEFLFTEEEAPKLVFVICSGKIKLSVSSREGRTAILRIAGPGEVLGISAVMSGTPHETSAEAVELCRVRAIHVSDFLRFLQDYPEAAAEATTCLLREYRIVLNNVCRLALPNTAAGRLASLLLEWLGPRRANAAGERRLIVTLTQEEIASMTNTSRETVSRVLHQFQRDKWISIKGASVTILQPQALEQLAV
jgi:CRP/FNR family cyclic AMP-dependent transcriptional regulator